MTTSTCRWCGALLSPSKFRPRVWCNDDCRRARIRAEARLAELEAVLAEARAHAADRHHPQRDHYRRFAESYAVDVAALRARLGAAS